MPRRVALSVALVAFLKPLADLITWMAGVSSMHSEIHAFIRATQTMPRLTVLVFSLGAYLFVYVTIAIAIQVPHHVSHCHLAFHTWVQIEHESVTVPALQLVRSSLVLGLH